MFNISEEILKVQNVSINRAKFSKSHFHSNLNTIIFILSLRFSSNLHSFTSAEEIKIIYPHKFNMIPCLDRQEHILNAMVSVKVLITTQEFLLS